MTMMIIMIKMVTQWCQETRGRALSPVWSSRQPTGGRWCSREAPGWINQVIIIIINDIIILFTWWGTWSNQVVNGHFKVDGMEDGIMQSDEIINRWRVEKKDDDGYLVQEYWPEWWMTSDKWRVTSEVCKISHDEYLVQKYWPEWWVILLLLVRPTGRTLSLSSASYHGYHGATHDNIVINQEDPPFRKIYQEAISKILQLLHTSWW